MRDFLDSLFMNYKGIASSRLPHLSGCPSNYTPDDRRGLRTVTSPHHSTFDDLEDYRNVLQMLRLDCNESVHFPSEGAYPIDLDEDSFKALVDGQTLTRHLPSFLMTGDCLMFLAPNSQPL